MTIEDDIQIVKDFFAAIGQGDKQGVVALCAEDIEWIIPGKGWPLPGTHRGHSGLEDLLELEILYPTPPEYVAQGDRVLVVGVATGKIKATNRVFKDDWVFAITVRKQQADEDPGVYRHLNTGAGLRDVREPQALTHLKLADLG